MAADKKPGPDAVASDVTFDPAVAWFQKRLGMTRAQVNRLTLDARRKVFFVTGLSDLELIKSVQDSLARSIENGSTFEEWKKEVKEKKLFQGPEFTHRRLETIFRTNMQNAFATGRYMEMTAPAVLKRRPYWRFSAVRDGRTTKVCAAAHGTILPANHPWWKTHIPPLHFNCRSTFVPMTEKDAKAAGITKTPTDLDSALGFGNPPDGVPAAAKDMPTEEEQKAKDAEAAKVRDEIEEAKAASSESTQANRQLTAARNERKEAEKAVRKASGDEIGPASDHLLETKRQEEEARRKAEAKKRKKEQAEENARKATDKGAPRNWEPTEKEVSRRFGKYGQDYIEMMRALKTAKPTTKNGRPAFEVPTPNGGSIIIQEGDLIREKLEEYITEKKWWSKVFIGAPPRDIEQDEKTTKAPVKETIEKKEKREKLDETKWGHIPKNIRENAEKTAKNLGIDLLGKPERMSQVLKNTNPKYSTGLKQFRYNCQRCVATFEARMRGLDAEACPIYSYKDPVASWEEITNVYKNGQKQAKWFRNIPSKEDLRKNFFQIIDNAPNGSRFTIVITTDTKFNHALNAYKDEEGRIFFIDTQCPMIERQKQIIGCLNNINLEKGFGIIRTDNLEFSAEAGNFFRQRTLEP